MAHADAAVAFAEYIYRIEGVKHGCKICLMENQIIFFYYREETRLGRKIKNKVCELFEYELFAMPMGERPKSLYVKIFLIIIKFRDRGFFFSPETLSHTHAAHAKNFIFIHFQMTR